MRGSTKPGQKVKKGRVQIQEHDAPESAEAAASLQRQINELQKGKNDRIEGLKSRLQFLNVVAVPALVALVGVGLAFARAQRRKANTGGAR